MNLSQKSLEYLAGIITGGKKSIYKKGPVLVEFFNDFGERDEYGKGFPTRLKFTEDKLNKFNGTDQLENIINKAFHPANIPTPEVSFQDLINEANSIFAYDGLKFMDTDRGAKIQEVSSSTQAVNIDSRLFQKDSFWLFISHKDDNKKTANDLKKALNVFGISSFVAHEDIEPSREWQAEIENALFSMDSLLALLSKGFSGSIWTNQEVGVALGRGIFILSVKSGEDPRGFLGKFQALRFYDDDIDELAKQIAEQFLINQKTSGKMKSAYINALSKTSTYSETERWSILLSSIDSLTDEQIKELIKKYNSNSQAYECFHINGGKYGNTKSIANFINKWTKCERYILSNKKLKEGTKALYQPLHKNF